MAPKNYQQRQQAAAAPAANNHNNNNNNKPNKPKNDPKPKKKPAADTPTDDTTPEEDQGDGYYDPSLVDSDGNIYDPNKTASAATAAGSFGNESYGNILKNLGLPFEAAPALGQVEAAKEGNALLPALIGGAASNIDWNKLISKIPGMG